MYSPPFFCCWRSPSSPLIVRKNCQTIRAGRVIVAITTFTMQSRGLRIYVLFLFSHLSLSFSAPFSVQLWQLRDGAGNRHLSAGPHAHPSPVRYHLRLGARLPGRTADRGGLLRLRDDPALSRLDRGRPFGTASVWVSGRCARALHAGTLPLLRGILVGEGKMDARVHRLYTKGQNIASSLVVNRIEDARRVCQPHRQAHPLRGEEVGWGEENFDGKLRKHTKNRQPSDRS